LRGWDLNPRPHGYEPCELPGCSTPRQISVAGLYVQLARLSSIGYIIRRVSRGGGIGRRTGLKIPRSQGHESSILSRGTKKKQPLRAVFSLHNEGKKSRQEEDLHRESGGKCHVMLLANHVVKKEMQSMKPLKARYTENLVNPY
jgi:hypothetical protein